MSGRIGTGGTGGSTFGLPEMFGGLYGAGFSIGSAGFSIGSSIIFSIGSVGFGIGCVGGGGGNVGGAVGLTTSGETEGTGGLGISLGGLGISLGGLVGMGAGGRVGLVSSLDSISTSPDSSGSIGRLSICCGTSISSSSVIGLSFT